MQGHGVNTANASRLARAIVRRTGAETWNSCVWWKYAKKLIVAGMWMNEYATRPLVPLAFHLPKDSTYKFRTVMTLACCITVSRIMFSHWRPMRRSNSSG